jgi:hypothetical protein
MQFDATAANEWWWGKCLRRSLSEAESMMQVVI